MRESRFKAAGVLALALCVLATTASCAASPEADERASFQQDLALEQIEGVVFAVGEEVVLDLDRSTSQIVAAASKVRALREEEDPKGALTLHLFRPGVASSETEFVIYDVGEQAQHFEEQVALWAELVTSGFAGVEMNLFGSGSEYGEGVISVDGWYGPGAAPSAGDTYFEIVNALPGLGLTPSLMQVVVNLDIWILNKDVSLPIADGLFETFERVQARMFTAFAIVEIGVDGAEISVGHASTDAGERVPLTDDEAASLLADFDAAGLLTDDLLITDVGRLETGSATLWGVTK